MTRREEQLDERSRLLSSYKRAKKHELEQLIGDPVHGEQLRKFIATTRSHFHKPEHAERMVGYVQRECRDWLSGAPQNIRHAALEACGNAEQRIRMNAGLAPFYDPVDGTENVFMRCKRMLG